MPKPILRIPMLAIHLQRDLSTAGFNPNKQTQCTPLLATSIKQRLEGGSAAAAAAAAEGAAPAAEGGAVAGAGAAAAGGAEGAGGRHHPLLLRLLSKELGCAPEDIVDFELNVVDTQPGVIGGGCFLVLCSGLCALALGWGDTGGRQPSPAWRACELGVGGSAALACSEAAVRAARRSACAPTKRCCPVTLAHNPSPGGEDEFIFCGRLDNLCMSYCALQVGAAGGGCFAELAGQLNATELRRPAAATQAPPFAPF